MRVGERRHESPLNAMSTSLRTFLWFLKSKLVGGTN